MKSFNYETQIIIFHADKNRASELTKCFVEIDRVPKSYHQKLITKRESNVNN